MKIVVVGASGRIGSRLVTMLSRDSHEVVAASRRSGVDVVTGEGLAEVLRGASVVVDVSDSSSFEDVAVMKFFKASTRSLLSLIQRVLGARNDPREVIADPHARYFGAELNERSLVAGDEAELGEMRFDDWLGRTAHPISDPHLQPAVVAAETSPHASLKANEFRISEVPPGSVLLLGDVAVFSDEGGFCATQARCTHRQGPLSEGTRDGSTVTCPLHGAQFNVWTGALLRGPAKDPLKTYAVTVDGDVGRVDVPLAQAVQGACRC